MYVLLRLVLFWLEIPIISGSRDSYYLGNNFKSFKEIGSVDLSEHESGFEFQIYILDPNFDNEKNEYGQIKFHKYTNMKNRHDTTNFFQGARR